MEDENITYQDGEEIPENNIESYFVWIPKYSYQLWDLGEYESLTSIDESKVHEIPIKFGLNNTSDEIDGECTTPMNEEKTQGLSGESGNCKIGDYMTPPAFISMGTNGLWVGKFETGYKGATSTTAAQVNSSDSNKVQIKPNVYSWRNIQLANAHLTSYNYKREYDSHMMKNTEWGAVAYLQHSKYGSSTSVRINNNSAYITGYAAKNEPTCGFTGKNELCNINESTNLGIDGTNTYNYKNPSSQVASTTGNYTGIYDMSGGAWEYMMSGVLDSTNSALLSGINSTYHSNFNGAYGEGGVLTTGINFPNARYFDTYTYSTSDTTFNRRILGDGTSEFGPYASVTYVANQIRHIGSWYSDESWFLYSMSPWIARSGHYNYGCSVGVFYFSSDGGYPGTHIGFHLVLAI